ncbi:unnamed protein product [Ixodes pacificus]
MAVMLSFNFKIVESELCEIPYFSATVFFFSPFVTSAIIFALMSRARTFLLRGRPLIVPGRPQPGRQRLLVIIITTTTGVYFFFYFVKKIMSAHFYVSFRR